MTLPTATIVIPSFNRPERLATCLRAIAGLDYPAERLSVEIVDDGSAAPLTPVVAAIATPFAVRCTRVANGGPATARNLGASLATGELLAFTDDDCVPAADWLIAHARAFQKSPDALIGGSVRNAIARNVFSDASQDVVDFLYDYFEAEPGGVPFFTSNNLACGRSVFLAQGGFDSSFPLAAAEDRELGIRWRRNGRRLVFERDAVIHHHHDLTLSKFWRQHRNYGIGARHLHKVLEDCGDDRPRFEKLTFYAKLITYPLKTGRRSALSRSVLMILSQLAMARGFALA